MAYEVKKPVKLPKFRSYEIHIRMFNDEESMNNGRECGAVQAGNWPEEGTSMVVGITVHAKNLANALANFLANPHKHFKSWSDRNEVVSISEKGSGRFRWECKCDIFANDRYGNDKGMSKRGMYIRKDGV